jgi:heavy metal translocating P-type ATPase
VIVTTASEEVPATSSGGAADFETVEYDIDGMHCNSCATRIERKLSRTPAVLSASVNLATNRAFVTYDPTLISSEDLCQVVDTIGYSARPTQDVVGPAREDPEHWVVRAFISWPLALAALAVSLFAPETSLWGWVVLVLAVVVEFAGGWPFLRTSAKLARHGATSMDTLIAVGTLAALAVSAVEAIALGGRHVHLGGSGAFAARLHGVMAPLIIAVLVTGRAVEARARGRAAEAMHSLLGLRPPTARVVQDPDDVEGLLVAPESVPVNALVRVRASEAIPLDGEVVAGWSAVDESMLTGEPMPVEHGPGSHVTGGTRNGHGPLVVRVETIAAESVLARMQRLVEAAQRDKAPIQRLADRISAVFVPAVLVGAAVTFAAWWGVAGNFGVAVLSAVAVLLVACPCAMGLATPVAMMVGTGRASTLGILVRSGDALERLAGADTVVFDKTGTLTERGAAVTGVAALPPLDDDRIVQLAAAVEAESEHPIAVAIRHAARGSVLQETEVEATPGVGVSGLVADHRVSVLAFDPQESTKELAAAAEPWRARGDTIVAVIVDERQLGAIAVATPVRADAAPAVERLHSLGLHTAILSGDAAPAVDAVAAELGIERAESALSPAQKLETLKTMQQAGRSVVMVGDGVNDAPALAAADVGCAVGSSAEAALSNSDVALMGSDLRGVPAAVGIAGATSAVIVQNFGWAMGYNISSIPLAAAGLLDPLVAAIAMGLSSLLVVLNSLRLLRLGRTADDIRPPVVLRGVRGFVVSVAVPMVLFAAFTVAAQSVSPSRGQPLLPVLPSVATVSLPGGVAAEVYLDPSQAGPNQFHLVMSGPGTATSAPRDLPHIVAYGPAGKVEPVRGYWYSPGHYLGYGIFEAGAWRFHVVVPVGGRTVAFSVDRTVS